MQAYSTVYDGSVKATLEIEQYDGMASMFAPPQNAPGTGSTAKVCTVELTIKLKGESPLKARAAAGRRAYNAEEANQSYAMSSMFSISKLGFPAGVTNANSIVPEITDDHVDMLEEKLSALTLSTETVVTTELGVGTKYYVYLVPDARNIVVIIAPEGGSIPQIGQAAAVVGSIVIIDREYDGVSYTSKTPTAVAAATISDGKVVVEQVDMDVDYVDKSMTILTMAFKNRGAAFLHIYQEYIKRMFWASGKFSDMGRYDNLLTYTYGIDVTGRGIVVVDNRTADIAKYRGGGVLVRGKPNVYVIYGEVGFPLRANFVTGPKIFDIVSGNETLTKYGPLTTAYFGAQADEPPFKYITSWDTRKSPALVEIDDHNVTL